MSSTIIEDRVFADYMTRLFDAATRFVIIYSNDEDAPWDGAHVRYHQFSRWVASNRSDFDLVESERNPHPEDPADPGKHQHH